MAIKSAVELEMVMRTRLHPIIDQLLITQGNEKQIEELLRNSVYSILYEMCFTGLIPRLFITEDMGTWCVKMSRLAVIYVFAGDATHVPTLNISLRALCLSIFENDNHPRFIPPAPLPTSSFVRSLRIETTDNTGDENFYLDLERRGLEEVLRPQQERSERAIQARTKMASELQESLKKEEEKQKREEREEAEREALGFQRKIDID